MAGIKPLEKVLSKVESKIPASAEVWSENTLAGFRENWADWYSGFALPVLVRVVPSLPPKTGNIEENVRRRVTPVAKAISEASKRYRAYKASKVLEESRALVRVE